ncbi:uncharacterized protein BDW70DRAFT_146105 [Aspergillus foveolatus]|uniref:uncharacterized protein n=1 Tax=Aspergillus foveolatus TaxID=210207 RepID=UPI003CCE1F0C
MELGMFSILFSLFQKPPPPLPHGWDRKWNQQYQRVYYVETDTGRWQWESPAVLREQKMQTYPEHGCECDNKSSKLLREYSAVERTATCAWAAPDSEIDQVDRII